MSLITPVTPGISKLNIFKSVLKYSYMFAGSIVCIIHIDRAIYRLLASKKKAGPREKELKRFDNRIKATTTPATDLAAVVIA